ncbi:MAG: hypothetical protein IJZ06_04055 [Bacteroidales bacterium]|nr:hypothetical protein [Bacteroidales bacterium]
MSLINKEKKYKWSFVNIGGSARVRIKSGDDIAHLAELDPKMWTVLSCPTTGLEIDDKSLKYMDCDGDGKLRINDIISVSQWIMSILKDKDLILKGDDSIDINQINTDDANGKKLYSSAKQILENLGKEGNLISLADTADITAIFAKTRFNGDGIITEASSDDADIKSTIATIISTVGSVADRSGAQGVGAEQIEAFYKNINDYLAWTAAKVEAPFSDKTDAIIEAYNALDAKVRDYFMRSKLAAFSPNNTAALDIQTSQIDAISAENLSTKNNEIAAYPLTHITGKAELNLRAAINPAWEKYFNIIKDNAIDTSKDVITEEDWNAVAVKFSAYNTWKNSKAGAAVESLGIDAMNNFLTQDKKAELLDLVAQDAALKEQSDNIDMVDKFLHIYRDFYRLLKNFVTFNDFYDKDRNLKSIFQCGTLIIDQRACKFCMKVNDTGKHSAAAGTSGMYLIYCDCTTKTKTAKMQIAAAVTVGDIGELTVGKNGVFYDNNGLEWDAVITKIVDNPINISQSFWSPYRRMATAIENLINKSAAEKDAKMMANATANINAAPTKTAADAKAAAATPPFDIAKVAGIFAAIGMAFGMIGTALASIFKGLFALKWWQLIMLFVGIIILISGPAMVMAWLKLRRRNIAPLLNANGWAVNAASKISIPFGETLTDIAKYPKMKLKDPFAKKGLKTWQKCLITFGVIVLTVGALWIFNVLSYINPKVKSPLPRYNKVEVVEGVVSDSLNVEQVEVIEEVVTE